MFIININILFYYNYYIIILFYFINIKIVFFLIYYFIFKIDYSFIKIFIQFPTNKIKSELINNIL